MASKKTAAILTVVGGAFYVLGGVALAALVDLIGGSADLLGGGSGTGAQSVCQFVGPFPCNTNASIISPTLGLSGFNAGAVAETLAVIGLITGGLIIFGGWLINSESSTRRKMGGILAVIMMLVGGLTTFGGLLVGFVLTCIGVYLAFTYRANAGGMVIPLGPMASVTLGSPQVSSNVAAGTGPLNYCTKCGSQIRPGSVFCGACGARLGE